jgi:hypothetical protein
MSWISSINREVVLCDRKLVKTVEQILVTASEVVVEVVDPNLTAMGVAVMAVCPWWSSMAHVSRIAFNVRSSVACKYDLGFEEEVVGVTKEKKSTQL